MLKFQDFELPEYAIGVSITMEEKIQINTLLKHEKTRRWRFDWKHFMRESHALSVKALRIKGSKMFVKRIANICNQLDERKIRKW